MSDRFCERCDWPLDSRPGPARGTPPTHLIAAADGVFYCNLCWPKKNAS